MKILQSSVFRALCAIIVGVLLIKYNKEMATWLTIFIGAVFFLSGIFSCASYFIDKKNVSETKVYDEQGNVIAGVKPSFPVAGIGSVVLGAILAFMPNVFIDFLMYILAALLILGAINLFVGLSSARRYSDIGIGWWILPSILLIVGILAIIRPLSLFSAPYLVIGWALIVYGVVEIANALLIYKCRREAMRMQKEQNAAKQIEEAEVLEEPAQEPAPEPQPEPAPEPTPEPEPAPEGE